MVIKMLDIFNQTGTDTNTSKPSSNETIITEDTVIVGSIAAQTSIVINGGIKGDVFSKHSVNLQGRVDGNIKANDITITDGAVKGDIVSNKNVLVSGSSVVVGNIFASSFESNGKIKGNVRIDGHAVIRENAVIQGNLSACNITVDDGAKIIGFVEIIKLTEKAGHVGENIEDIVSFSDIEIPTDAGNPDDMGSSDPVDPVTPSPLFTAGSDKVEPEISTDDESAEEDIEEQEQEEDEYEDVEDIKEEKSQKNSESGGEIEFADEKQKMLNDLRSRMEKAKKNGQSL